MKSKIHVARSTTSTLAGARETVVLLLLQLSGLTIMIAGDIFFSGTFGPLLASFGGFIGAMVGLTLLHKTLSMPCSRSNVRLLARRSGVFWVFCSLLGLVVLQLIAPSLLQIPTTSRWWVFVVLSLMIGFCFTAATMISGDCLAAIFGAYAGEEKSPTANYFQGDGWPREK